MSRSEEAFHEFGPFHLDPLRRVLLRDGSIVPLPPKVLDTLVVLVRNREHLILKDELMRAVWGDVCVEESNLTHNISVLRHVLGKTADGTDYITTVPKRGYQFTAEVKVAMADLHPGAHLPSRIHRRAWVGILAVSFVAISGALLAIHRTVEQRPPLRLVPLTAYPGTEAFPTFSPDGKRVAFIWNGEKQDQFDLYVKEIGTEVPIRLTSDPEPECYPQWSPDGRWIAFLHCASWAGGPRTQREGDVYLVSPSGGPKRKVGRIEGEVTAVSRPIGWAPDSTCLVLADAAAGRSEAGLSLLYIESTRRRQLMSPPAKAVGDSDPTISPDGRLLAFVRWQAYSSGDIYLVGIDRKLHISGEPGRITFENDFIGSIMWSPDSKEILYAAGREGGRGLWRIKARSGSAPVRVSTIGEFQVHLALSRQGDKLAYSRPYWDFDIWRTELDDPKANTPVRLIASTFSDSFPQFSPDGSQIAFQSDRSGATEIWRAAADGSAPTQVTTLRAEAGSPMWSPDGTQIAFDCRRTGNMDVYSVGASGGDVRRLTTDPSSDNLPSWSRDGKWIYFTSKRTGRDEVWRVPAGGGDAIQVTNGGGFRAIESTDGQFLYFAKMNTGGVTLWRKSLDAGPEEQIIDSLRYWMYFAVCNDGIYFIPKREPSAPVASFRVGFYDFATKRVRTISEIGKWSGLGFSISQNRRSVLFAPSELRGSDLMLAENFH